LDTDNTAEGYRKNVLLGKLTAFVKQLAENIIQRYLAPDEDRGRKAKNVRISFQVAQSSPKFRHFSLTA